VDVIPIMGSTGNSSLGSIAEVLRETFCDGPYLVFANSRRTVEELADRLLGTCELNADGEPALALHHGSLSAQVRRRTESMLKSGQPTRALCTSSLELGIDIGAVEAVAQIDPTWSVASLVQRLGRSGRSIGATSKLRLYVRIPPLAQQVSFVELLYPSLLQAVAIVKLLLAGWLESANSERLHLSTLVHQILSVLKETGGQNALALYQILCRQGAFRCVEPTDFKYLLQGLRGHDLINQDTEGVIFLGMAGERITSAPNFYAAFCTPVELTVRCGAKELGRIPASFALKEGECLLLNGSRWLIDNIDWKAKTVWVSATSRRQAPVFLGGIGEVNDRIFQEMRRVLVTTEQPDWLDSNGLELLRSARHTALEAGLLDSDLVELENGVQWFPWVGTRTMRTLQLWAVHVGLSCTKDSLSLTFEDISRTDLRRHLARLAEAEIDAVGLAALMTNKRVERFDVYVNETLLDKSNSECRLNVKGAKQAARRTVARCEHSITSE
jgi:ATP-dependent Lhr-like helicase